MKHVMNLQDAPYDLIQEGIKTVELRLYDEKRKTISVGDEIVFLRSSDQSASLRCRVISLHRFASFEELYKNLPLLKCGYTEDNVADASPDDMELYYSKEKQSQYGVIGIEIELCR